MMRASLTSSVSLLNNNLAASPSGVLVSVHNTDNVGGGKLLVHSMVSSSSNDGPTVAQVTSLSYVALAAGSVLCVSSTNGTRIYNEDATAMLFFAPISNTQEADVLKHHKGVCGVPSL